MAKIDDVLTILHLLRKNNGNVISLSSIYKAVIREGVYDSYRAISSCLKKLEMLGKIKLINFGSNIKLLDKEENTFEKTEYVQSSLFDLKGK